MCRLDVPSDDGGLMPAGQTTVKIDASDAIVNNLRMTMESSPQLANAARNLLLRDGQRIKGYAEVFAEGEIHRRPGNRRTAETRGRRHFNDSFVVRPNRANRLSNMVVDVGSTHPMGWIIENGSPAHEITGNPDLRFPYFMETSSSGPGQLGVFALHWTEGKIAKRHAVSHPGTAPHHILRRALDQYKRETARERMLGRD